MVSVYLPRTDILIERRVQIEDPTQGAVRGRDPDAHCVLEKEKLEGIRQNNQGGAAHSRTSFGCDRHRVLGTM